MNLVPVPMSDSERAHLDRRGLGFGPGQTALAKCIAKRNGGDPLSVGFICGNNVYTGSGFADTEGAPFKAYYCAACGERLRGALNHSRIKE